MTTSKPAMFTPHVASREQYGETVWCVQVQTDKDTFTIISQPVRTEALANRDLYAFQRAMTKDYLARNAGTTHLLNTEQRIKTNDDFLHFAMEMYNNYRPIIGKPDTINPYYEPIMKADADTWAKGINRQIMLAAYLSIKYPTWEILSMLPHENGSEQYSYILSKDGETLKVKGWADTVEWWHSNQIVQNLR